jgi:hypothetical protein
VPLQNRIISALDYFDSGVRKDFPQRLKPDSSARVTAQLKLCPFKTESFLRCGTGKAVPLQNSVISALDYFDSGLRKDFPQRLKPDSSARVTAQLKLCPFKTGSFPRCDTGKAVPLQNRIISALDYFDS